MPSRACIRVLTLHSVLVLRQRVQGRLRVAADDLGLKDDGRQEYRMALPFRRQGQGFVHVRGGGVRTPGLPLQAGQAQRGGRPRPSPTGGPAEIVLLPCQVEGAPQITVLFRHTGQGRESGALRVKKARLPTDA